MVTPPDRAAVAVTTIDGSPEKNADNDGLDDAFAVELENFSGPFDLLLSLISKHRLDITEVALAQVTDEFISYVRHRDWPLEESSEFLVVAATLLDLKAARLLPAGEVEDAEDIARLEARDLLFARLLQYRAYRDVAEDLQHQFETAHGWYPRQAGMEAWAAKLLPELVWSIDPESFAAMAANALSKKPASTTVDLSHLHAPKVSVRDEATNIISVLRDRGSATFRSLTSDAEGLHVVVARFLALLELFRENVVAFDQVAPLGDLTIRWTGTDNEEVNVSDEHDLEPIDSEPETSRE